MYFLFISQPAHLLKYSAPCLQFHTNNCVSLKKRFNILVLGPAMNWRLFQSGTLPSPHDYWERLQREEAGIENKWMDAFILECLML